MTYVDKTLGEGEKIIYRAHFNWTYFLSALGWLLLGTVPAILFACLSYFAILPRPGPWSAEIIISIVAFCLGIYVFFGKLIHASTTEIFITNIRMIVKTGLLSRNSHEVAISNIEEVWFHQSLLGHLLNYGEITIRGTGVGMITLPPLGAPLEIQRHLEDARAKSVGVAA